MLYLDKEGKFQDTHEGSFEREEEIESIVNDFVCDRTAYGIYHMLRAGGSNYANPKNFYKDLIEYVEEQLGEDLTEEEKEIAFKDFVVNFDEYLEEWEERWQDE